MNKSESKYYNTAVKMDEAFLALLEKKDFEYITVKEICTLSGVNRSTFYLHYEAINDLLMETAEYISEKFYSYFSHLNLNANSAVSAENDDLIFIKPEFLEPYLKFIKDNKVVYSTILKKFDSLKLGGNIFKTSKRVIYAVLDRFNVPENRREYMMMFYLEGITAIVKQWIVNDCKDSISEIICIIEECVRAR